MSRKEYVEKLKNQIEEWEYDLNRLEHRIDDVQEDLKEKYKVAVKDLKVKKDEMLEKAKHVESSTEEAWDDLKNGIEMAWDSLKLGILAAKSEYEDDKKDD